jgi:hypothetical protein
MASDLAAFAHPTNEGEIYLVGGYNGPYFASKNVTVVKYSTGSTLDDLVVTYADGPRLNGKRGDVDTAIVDIPCFYKVILLRERVYHDANNDANISFPRRQVWIYCISWGLST